MINRNRLQLSKIALCVAIAVGSATVYAQNTTSALSGRITAVDGKSVAGAAVKIVHVDSGSVTTTSTDADGRYSARGLRTGGPYTITITKDGKSETRNNVFLTLAETAVLDAKLGEVKPKVETIDVSASAISDAFSKSAMGAGSNIGRAELEGFGSINRNLQDYARNDPRLSQTDKERGEISLGGQNSRYNSVTVDGVNISDTFGLEANNLPTLKQPISIDAIQSVQVNVSNYDVTQKGYTGVNINAVTKSGTNDFKGSVYKVYRDDKYVNNQNYNRQTGLWTPRSPFLGRHDWYHVWRPDHQRQIVFLRRIRRTHLDARRASLWSHRQWLGERRYSAFGDHGCPTNCAVGLSHRYRHCRYRCFATVCERLDRKARLEHQRPPSRERSLQQDGTV